MPSWSRGEGGVNAVTGLAAILVALEKLDVPAPEHPAFAGMRCTITPGTLFSGGEFESMVPARAEALVDVRLMPGQPAKTVLDAMQAIIDAEIARRPGLAVTLTIKNDLPAAAIPVDHPLVKIAERYTEAMTGPRGLSRGRDRPMRAICSSRRGFRRCAASVRRAATRTLRMSGSRWRVCRGRWRCMRGLWENIWK